MPQRGEGQTSRRFAARLERGTSQRGRYGPGHRRQRPWQESSDECRPLGDGRSPDAAQTETRRRADRRSRGLDQGRRPGSSLRNEAADADRRAPGRREEPLGLSAYRGFASGLAGCARRRQAGAGRRQANADSPCLFRSDRGAADLRRGEGLHRRQVAAGVREVARQTARRSALRRTMGPALARRGPLCRQHGLDLQWRRQLSERLHVPRLRHSCLQRRQAVRSIPPRADCGRSGGYDEEPGDVGGDGISRYRSPQGSSIRR